MAKRTDISSIMIIGAGPIVIGQACEFDYSGTQACKALREEGYRVILVNSNPATIMTDPDLADATYVEPITPEVVARIIEIASGMPFDQFVQARIFDPLDMRDTHWNMPENKQHRYPVISNDKGSYIRSPFYFSGSVGLLSTARDFMHFEQMLVNKGSLFGHQLLNNLYCFHSNKIRIHL